VLDIGGGTSDIAIFANNAVQFTTTLPVGGAHFTRDLAIGLQTPIEEAERIKKESGTVMMERIPEEDKVVVPGIGTRATRSVPRNVVCGILRDRAVELLELVKDQIWAALNNDRIIAGVVVTGGGSLLDGILELTEETLSLPVRHGLPLGVQGLTNELSHPVYATAIGLALFGAEEAGYRNKNHRNTNSSPWLFNRILSWAS
jgi:cell division protein FtsA